MTLSSSINMYFKYFNLVAFVQTRVEYLTRTLSEKLKYCEVNNVIGFDHSDLLNNILLIQHVINKTSITLRISGAIKCTLNKRGEIYRNFFLTLLILYVSSRIIFDNVTIRLKAKTVLCLTVRKDDWLE